MPYSKEVLERFEQVTNNPQKFNVGRFDPKDPNVATGMAGAPACGDVMRLQLKLDIDDRIEDVVFKTYGCGSAIASSSMFVEMLKGKTVEEAKVIYETLQGAVGERKQRSSAPKSLSEAVTKRSSALLKGSEAKQEADPKLDRMKRLAGIN